MWGPTFGQHPMWLGLPITDTVTGIFAAMGVMGALRERDRTGEAQRVDISLYDVSAVLNEKNIAFHSITGRKPHGMSEMTNQLGVIQASDGFLVIGVVSAFISGLFAIKLLFRILDGGSTRIFVAYRFAFAAVLVASVVLQGGL